MLSRPGGRYLSNWTSSGQVSVELDIFLWTLQRLQAARGHGGEPGVLALEHGGHHVGRSSLMLSHNEVRLTAPRRPRIIQLRTMQQHDQAGGLPLPFREIGKHRPAI